MKALHRLEIAAAAAISAASAHAADYAFSVAAAPSADFRTSTLADDQGMSWLAASQLVATYIRYSNALAMANGNQRDYVYVAYADNKIAKFKICSTCSMQAVFVSQVAAIPTSAYKRSSLYDFMEAINRLDYMNAESVEIFWQQTYWISVGPAAPISDLQIVM